MTHNDDWLQMVISAVSVSGMGSRPFSRARATRGGIVRGVNSCERPLAKRNLVGFISLRCQSTDISCNISNGPLRSCLSLKVPVSGC